MNDLNTLPLGLGLVITSFLITAVLIVPFINLLYKLKMTRRKQGVKGGKSVFDKMHDKKAGTPTGGGILLIALVAILFSIVFPVARHLGVYIKSSFKLNAELFVLFFTFISFGALGYLDDHLKLFGKAKKGLLPQGRLNFGLTRSRKFVFQIITALVVGFMLHSWLGIQILHIPIFNVVLNLGWLYVPFAAFVIVFFVNAFNFTDGLDGLASGLLMVFLFSFLIIAAGNLDTPLSVFIGLWIGAIIAFMYFNVYPARIFLGDAGAMSFGAMIALIGLMTGSVVPLFVIGGLFVVEAASSLIQILGWKFLKKPILPAAPFHHTLERIGWEEPKIVMRAWIAGIMLAVFGLWLAFI